MIDLHRVPVAVGVTVAFVSLLWQLNERHSVDDDPDDVIIGVLLLCIILGVLAWLVALAWVKAIILGVP